MIKKNNVIENNKNESISKVKNEQDKMGSNEGNNQSLKYSVHNLMKNLESF